MRILRAYARFAPTERGGYRLVRGLRRFVPKESWSGYFAVDDSIEMNLDLGVYPDCCMACGLYELDTYRILKKSLRPGMHFLDVGANIGYFTLLAARLVGQAGRIDAIEPDPVNRLRLEEHLNKNGMGNAVCVHAVAASDREGMVDLWHPEEGLANHGMSSIYYGIGKGAARYHVPAARLDEVIPKSPDVVKMDIEGAEYNALKGMERWLLVGKPPIIIVEHNQSSAKAAGWQCGDILRYLQGMDMGWEAFWIGQWPKKLAGPAQIDSIHRQGNILYRLCNDGLRAG